MLAIRQYLARIVPLPYKPLMIKYCESHIYCFRAQVATEAKRLEANL